MLRRGMLLFALVVSLGACGGDAEEDAAPASTVEPIEVEAIETVIPIATATEAATATEEVVATEVPTDEPTVEAATAVPATAVPAPVDPTAPPPPTEAGPPRPDVNPDGDRDCKDFANRQEAQKWWDYWHANGYPNPGRLDGGRGNGIVCEDY